MTPKWKGLYTVLPSTPSAVNLQRVVGCVPFPPIKPVFIMNKMEYLFERWVLIFLILVNVERKPVSLKPVAKRGTDTESYVMLLVFSPFRLFESSQAMRISFLVEVFFGEVMATCLSL